MNENGRKIGYSRCSTSSDRQDVERPITESGKLVHPSMTKYVPTKLVLEYIGLDEDYIFKMAARII